MDASAGNAAMARLEPFIGGWSMQASFPDAPVGHSVFDWALERQFLVQRSEVPHPAAPDGLSIMAFDPEGQGYLQHYFDSRGVVRLYAMTFSDGIWTLLRDKPDFSPLDFSQRFRGVFSDDANVIDGRWETSEDGSSWELDFELRYTRVE
jgi:hypothetical protein